jgi:hypothetical protein
MKNEKNKIINRQEDSDKKIEESVMDSLQPYQRAIISGAKNIRIKRSKLNPP